jgi:tetratricopeptide (TPR) repeat protein
MRIALEHKPNDWERYFGLGMVLQAQQKHGDAAAVFERALSLNPDDRHCLANLLSSELELEHIEVAERLAHRAVKTHQDSVVAWSNLGVVMDRLDRYDEALAAFKHADSVSSKTGEPNAAFVNHAICLLRAGRTSEAIELFEARLPTTPSIQGHCHYSLALLLSGRMREGWDQYEFRWLDGPLKKSRPTVLAPAWAGQGIEGKTILVRSEQGFGDFFQFIRYARYLKSMGARVLLQLHEAMRETAKWIEGIDHVLAVGEPYGTLDYYTNLLSLPRVFGTELHNIPADIPYIRVDPSRRVQWNGRLTQDSSLKVGLAWAGSPTHLRDKFRSIDLAQLEPLARIPRIKFYSLQKGPAAAAARIQTSLDITDFESDLNDFADTAALINELDLVICVDTSVAHLA